MVREAPDLLSGGSATYSTEQIAKGAHHGQSGLPCSGRAASGIYWVDAHAPRGTSESPTRGKCKGTHASGAAMKPEGTPVKQLVAQLASQAGRRLVRRVYSPSGRADRPCVLGIALCRDLAEVAQAARSARVALGWPSDHTSQATGGAVGVPGGMPASSPCLLAQRASRLAMCVLVIALCRDLAEDAQAARSA